MKYLLLWSLLMGLGSFAQNSVFDPENSKGQLFEYAEVANTGKSNFTLAQVKKDSLFPFKNLESENQSVGFTSDSYWLRFKLQNSSNTPKDYYLETARPITDEADLYQIGNDMGTLHFKSGDQIPFNERQVAHRSTVFKIELPPNSIQNFYLNLKSDGETINLPLNLYSASSFWQVNYKQQMFLGIFYGLLLLAGIIYLFFYFSLKEKSFLYYGCYVFSIGLMQAALDGFIFQYALPQGGFFNARVVLVTAILSNFFLLKYSEHFLYVSDHLPRLSKVFMALYALLAISLCMVFISPKALELAYPFCNINGLLSLITILVALFTMRYRRIPIDPYFSIGIFFLVIGLLGFVMNNLSLLPNNFYTLNSAKFGTGFEIIFLSLSMTNLIRKLRLEKEKSQEEALQKAEEISGLKTYFMSNMSHELRTPLNIIMGIAEIEISKPGNNDQRKQFEIIKNASYSLLSNVNDILDFEKIEKKEIQLKHEVFNPSVALTQISNNWKSEAENKGLNYLFEMEGEIPALVNGDAARFSQIINNVLGNAVKYTANGSINFKLQVIRKNKGLFCFSFSISDTGIGMSQEFKKNIFDSFSQMRLNHTRQFGGIGLGLAIVGHLVELHHGSITIESKESIGTKVIIDLPIEGVVQEQLGEIETVPQKNRNDILHVLVVEDNLLNQMVMKKMLNSYTNVSFSMANNGTEAIDALKKDSYDIVLMDLQMPIMDGYEATRIIRSGELGKTVCNIPIIAVTADAMEETHKKVLDIGMNDYMTKPINRDLLFKKMNFCTNSILQTA